MSTVEPRRAAVSLSNGVEMPLLGLGVWQIADGRQTENAVTWALEAGYRHVDTARLYGNEPAVGRAIRASGLPRTEVFVTTKLQPRARRPARAVVEQWAALEHAYDQGLARAIGVSNWGAHDLDDVVARGRIPPHVDQVQFSPFQFRRALLAHCHELQITLEGYSPLTRGRSLEDPTVMRVAQEHGRTPAQVMLRWAIERDVAVIPKSAHRERIVENAEIFDFQLAPDAIATLDALDRTGGTAEA